MIDLTNPEARRGFRSVVQGLVQFALLAFVYSLIDDLHGDAPSLRLIALAALLIIGLDELGYVMENGMRAFKVTASASGIDVDAAGGNGNG